MPASTIATLGDLFHRVYEPELPAIFREEVPMLKIAQRKTKPFAGAHNMERIGCIVSRAGGAGGRAETQALPTPVAATVVEGSVPLARKFAVFEMSHDAIESSQGQETAYVEVLGFHLERSLEVLKKLLNFDFLGDGRGILATPSAAVTFPADTTATQVAFGDTSQLEPGQRVAFWASNADTAAPLTNGGQSGTLDSDQLVVVSVDSATLATLQRLQAAAGTAAVTTTTPLRLYGEKPDAASLPNSMQGLRLLSDDGTIRTSFESISRTAYPRWQGRLQDSSGQNLAMNHIERLADSIARACGEAPDNLVWDPSLRREYLNLVRPDRRFAPLRPTDAGDDEVNVITIGGKPLRVTEDMDCPKGLFHIFAGKWLEFWEKSPIQLDQTTGSPLRQGVPYGTSGTGDVFFGYLRVKGNLVTRKAPAFGTAYGFNWTAE